MLDLGTLVGPAGSSLAEAINELGTIVGVSSNSQIGAIEAFLWDEAAGMVGLGDLPGGSYYSWARAVNIHNHGAGTSVSTHYGEWMEEAFYWDAEHGMIGLGNLDGSGHGTSVAFAINDDGWVTGWSVSSGGIRAFLWTLEDGMMDLTDLSGSPVVITDGWAINQHGQITGRAANPDSSAWGIPFIWTPGEGVLTLEPLPGHEDAGAGDINDHGVIVGASARHFPTVHQRAFIWDAENGMRDLTPLIAPCDAGPAPVHFADRINNRGQIRAYYSGHVILDPYLPGDLDEDSDVDLQDLATLLSNFGRTADATYENGDLDCDADVDLQDLATLLNNFGQTLP